MNLPFSPKRMIRCHVSWANSRHVGQLSRTGLREVLGGWSGNRTMSSPRLRFVTASTS